MRLKCSARRTSKTEEKQEIEGAIADGRLKKFSGGSDMSERSMHYWLYIDMLPNPKHLLRGEIIPLFGPGMFQDYTIIFFIERVHKRLNLAPLT